METRELGAKCLEKLLQREWFSRMWTVQELALSQHCIMVCGRDAIDWEAMMGVVMHLTKIPTCCLIEMPATGHLLAEALILYEEYQLPERQLMLQFLYACRSKNSTDPRDKVYGLFGLLQAVKIKVPEPDYNKTVEEVYIDAARM